MAKFNDSTIPAMPSTSANNFSAAYIPTAKRTLAPPFMQNISADTSQPENTISNTRLCVGGLKHTAPSPKPSYSGALSFPAQDIGQFSSGVRKKSRNSPTTANSPKPKPTPSSNRPSNSAVSGAKLGQNSKAVLIPVATDKEMIFSQAEALSTITGGQAINFSDALATFPQASAFLGGQQMCFSNLSADENNPSGCVKHTADTEKFIIQDCGIYEIHYSLTYDVSSSGLLIFGFENFLQSYAKQQITQGPSRGKLDVTVRLMLEKGSALRLILVGDSDSSAINRASISNAVLEIKPLYRCELRCPNYSTVNPSENISFKNRLI